MFDALIIDEFCEILEIEKHEFSDQIVFQDLDAWDSLAELSLLMAIEEHFGLVISGDDLSKVKTIGDLKGYLSEREA